MAAADFNRDGKTDVAVGAPSEDVGAYADTGGSIAAFGSASVVVGLAVQINLNQDAAGVPDDPEAGDRFGAAL